MNTENLPQGECTTEFEQAFVLEDINNHKMEWEVSTVKNYIIIYLEIYKQYITHTNIFLNTSTIIIAVLGEWIKN